MPDEYGYTSISEFHNLIKQDDPLYKDGFKAVEASERIITLQDDDSLRFIKRVLEGAHQTDSDKAKCLEMISEIRTRIRGGYTDE